MEIKVIKLSEEIQEFQIPQIIEDKRINEITMQYMVNRLYSAAPEEPDEDTSFYRSRIFQLSKVLLLNEKEREKYYSLNPTFHLSQISCDVITAFDHFAKTAVQNFKINDTNELYKQEIAEETKETVVTEFKEYIPSKQQTLDNFLIKTTVEPIYPEQKHVDIQDKKFKKKGLRKFNIS